jgi:hypothetical protein
MFLLYEILSVVLYERQNYSVFLREEQRLRVFENTVPRGILGPKRGEVTGGWKKYHDERFYKLHSSQNSTEIKSRKFTWARYVARMG